MWSPADICEQWERNLSFSSADVRGAGTRDEPLRTSVWELWFKLICTHVVVINIKYLFCQAHGFWKCRLKPTPLYLQRGKQMYISFYFCSILVYCAFHKHVNSEVQKPTDDCVFRCRQSSYWTSKETKLYFNRFKRSWLVICDWWISICFVCFCISRFIACDHNYDWRQRKTQLWRQLLNFRVFVFVKSAVRFQAFCFS